MALRSDNSIESLQRSVVLYRKLLSLIQTSGSEQEVGKIVVDMLFEEFPDFRISFTRFWPDNRYRVCYSRQPTGMKDISGLAGQLAPSAFAENFSQMRMSVIEDIRTHESTKAVADWMIDSLGSLARIDFPFEKKEDGEIGILSLSHVAPRQWSPTKVQVLQEIAELVRLMFREARYREKLALSETLFRQFAQNMPMVFWVSEPQQLEHDGRMIYVSPAYEQIWGYAVKDLMESPRSFIDAIHPEDRSRVLEAIKQQVKGPYQQLYRIVRPDGSVRWINDRGNPIFNEKGEAYRLLGIAEDVTAIHDTKVLLENTQAQVIANAKFAALGEMAGGIAHEINNPLAVISGLAQQMRERAKQGIVAAQVLGDCADTLEKMCGRIAAIVKGLRTFSRQTKTDPMQPADVCSILRETLALCAAKVQAAKAKLELSLPANLPLKCRSAEISQVILNLVNNALDAVANTSRKEIMLRALVHEGQVELSVEDTGQGIRPEIRDEIFHPFFTTKDVGKGTGLGLSISKGIVEAHGGKLFLDTNHPQTRFVVQLPLEA